MSHGLIARWGQPPFDDHLWLVSFVFSILQTVVSAPLPFNAPPFSELATGTEITGL
jgi:hypothetical protein